jgi:vacuolar-type H+-ATPase subunit I/STV1
MMDLTWFLLGFVSAGVVYFLYELSRKEQLDWISWTGLILGIFAVLFGIAWAVGSVLEGEPRAASMGILMFGLSGIILLTLTARFIAAKKRTLRK